MANNTAVFAGDLTLKAFGDKVSLGDLYDIHGCHVGSNLFDDIGIALSESNFLTKELSSTKFREDSLTHRLTESSDGKCNRCYALYPCRPKPENRYQKPTAERVTISPVGVKRVSEILFHDLLTVMTKLKQRPTVSVFRFKMADSNERIRAFGINQFQQLKILREECEQSHYISDLILGHNATVGLLYRKTITRIESKLCDPEMQPLGFQYLMTKLDILKDMDCKSRHIINKIDYGVEILLMFGSNRQTELEIQNLVSDVEILAKCLEEACRPEEIQDQLPAQRYPIEIYVLGSKVLKTNRRCELFSLVKHIRDTVKSIMFKNSSGRGVPVRFQLIDIRRVFKGPSLTQISNYIGSYTFIKYYELGDQIDLGQLISALRKINQILEDRKWNAHKTRYNQMVKNFKSSLRNAVTKASSGGSVVAIKMIIEEFLESENSPQNILEQLDTNSSHTQMSILEDLMLAKGAQLLRERSKIKDEDFLVFKYPKDVECRGLSWKTNYDYFTMLLEKKTIARKFYVQKTGISLKVCIQLIKHGEIACSDMLAAKGKGLQAESDYENYMVTYDSVPVYYQKIDSFRGVLSIACPMSAYGCCSIKARNWNCKECKTLLGYENHNVQCLCGQVPLSDCRFLCSNLHQLLLVPKGVLPPPKPRSEYSILLLGDSGSGKSTFIDGVGNYILNPNLDSAIWGRCFYSDPNRDPCVGTTGSKTKKIQSYTFTLPTTDKIIRIIDTPGYKKNLSLKAQRRELISTLNRCSQFYLNAIAIFVDSLNLELSKEFTSNFLVLFELLEERRMSNAMVVFTKCRGRSLKTLFQDIGLRSLVRNDETYSRVRNRGYMIDNIAIEYLRSISQGKKGNRNLAATSWADADSATKQFIEEVTTMKPMNLRTFRIPLDKMDSFALEDTFYLDILDS